MKGESEIWEFGILHFHGALFFYQCVYGWEESARSASGIPNCKEVLQLIWWRMLSGVRRCNLLKLVALQVMDQV